MSKKKVGQSGCPTSEGSLRTFQAEAVRANLVRAGLFLLGWELLKANVENKVRDFFQIGFDDHGWKWAGEYKTRILAKHKNRFEASLQWLAEVGGLTDVDASTIRQLRTYRNEVVQELPRLLLASDYSVSMNRIVEIKNLLANLSEFWGRVEEISSVELGNQSHDVQSGTELLMDLLVDTAATVPDGHSATVSDIAPKDPFSS